MTSPSKSNFQINFNSQHPSRQNFYQMDDDDVPFERDEFEIPDSEEIEQPQPPTQTKRFHQTGRKSCGGPKTPNRQLEVKNYHNLISKSSLEKELKEFGYNLISKIVIRANSGEKRTQYVKAINKMGQKVFILIDVNGFTIAHPSNLTLIESNNANMIPLSFKNGAYNLAVNEISGVAFECGSDAICVVVRDDEDLTPREANFVYMQKHTEAVGILETEGNIMTYPVIRLSEIRANPALILENTNNVTRRLRNAMYISADQELNSMYQSLLKLNEAFVNFQNQRSTIATKISSTLDQLDSWNHLYMQNLPSSDEEKDKYRNLLYNLVIKNDNVCSLLGSMNKVVELRSNIDSITKDIQDVISFNSTEFINVEGAIIE